MSRLEPTNEASAMQKEISDIAEQGGGRATKVEQLIQQYCPDGVEYKKLGDVCDIKGRIGFRGYTRQDLVEEADGAITLSPSNIINQELNYEDCSYISWAKYEESPEIKVAVGDVIFTKTASVGKTALVKYLPKEATINPQLVVLKNIQCNSAFLAYVLQTYRFQKEVAKLQGVGSVPNISQTSLSGITIPIPPLPVQEEIVRILDSFTELQAELQAELQKRLQQYNYYRDKLLSFSELNRGGQGVSVEWKKLGEIAQYAKERVDSSLISTHTYVSVENLLQNKEGKKDASTVPSGSLIKYEKGDILIGNIRPYLKKIWLADIDGGTNGDVLTIRITDKDIISSYLYHILASDAFFLYDMSYAKGAKMPRGDKTAVMNYIVPVPPLAEQKRIVDILDRFDTLASDITAGLPAEIEARRKQYEYYRDQLLTFKQKAS